MSMELRDEARRREQERQAIRRNRERLALDLRAVASGPEGARVLTWFVRQGDIFRPDYQPGVAGAYQAGKKAAALELWRVLRECLPRDRFVAIALGEENDGDVPSAELPGTDFDETSID